MDSLFGAPLEKLGVFPLPKPVKPLLDGRVQRFVDDIRTANVPLRGLVGQGDRTQKTFAKFAQHNAHITSARTPPLIRAR